MVHGTTPGLLSLRSTKEHIRRRRLWNVAFNTASIKNYEPVIQKRALQLASELEKCSHSPDLSIDLSEWITYFA